MFEVHGDPRARDGLNLAKAPIRLIRMPTTTLAMNDAGVGVKNGINAFGRKNFTGTFAPPFAVINDFAFLETLSRRDLRAGIAEAVKVQSSSQDGALLLLEETERVFDREEEVSPVRPFLVVQDAVRLSSVDFKPFAYLTFASSGK